jgi:predicted phage terminase large subunit-like protein
VGGRRLNAALKIVNIGPQKGPQEAVLSTRADIAIFGGSAGGGKSYALLLEPLRHFNNARFGGVVFRRTSVQIRNEGGLWDESYSLYKQLGAHPREAFLEWTFPAGSRIKFAHLEHEKSIYDWQGSQLAFLGFDELTHFTEKMFFYMLSRVRSMSGVPGYVRATTNPDADSWVRTFIDWWIGPDGYPIPDRCGKLRWFIRRDDLIIWADSREELLEKYGADEIPMSVTFIPSKLDDNPKLLAKDPTYRAKLRALSRVDRARLEGGNWNVRVTAGMLFQREWFPVLDAIPSGWIASIRFWDRAATKPNEGNKDPDWTRGLKLLKYTDGSYVVADLKSMRDTPGQVERLVVDVASHDGRATRIMSQQDPGSAGVSESEHFIRMLSGYDVKTETMPKDKVTRCKPVSAQAEARNIRVLRAPWNEEFFKEMENFPPPPNTGHDDIVDTLSGAFNELSGASRSLLDVL